MREPKEGEPMSHASQALFHDVGGCTCTCTNICVYTIRMNGQVHIAFSLSLYISSLKREKEGSLDPIIYIQYVYRKIGREAEREREIEREKE